MTSRFPHVVLLMVVAVCVVSSVASCGGKAPGSAPAGGAAAVEPGATYLQGLHASEMATLARERGLVCAEPVKIRDMSHWICQASTPLVTYMVEYYGKIPGRLEYIRAVVTQSGAPKAALALAFLKSFAGSRYEGANPAQAVAWVEQNAPTGGRTMIGPASYRLSGDAGRVVLEIKAPGSEW